MFDAEGTRVTQFDPEPFLKHPVVAFVAGDFTTPSGSTEPSLVYVSSGGEVVAFYGLIEQVGSTRLLCVGVGEALSPLLPMPGILQ